MFRATRAKLPWVISQPFGAAGGARGVDQGRDVVEARRAAVPFELGVADSRARSRQGWRGAVLRRRNPSVRR